MNAARPVTFLRARHSSIVWAAFDGSLHLEFLPHPLSGAGPLHPPQDSVILLSLKLVKYSQALRSCGNSCREELRRYMHKVRCLQSIGTHGVPPNAFSLKSCVIQIPRSCQAVALRVCTKNRVGFDRLAVKQVISHTLDPKIYNQYVFAFITLLSFVAICLGSWADVCYR